MSNKKETIVLFYKKTKAKFCPSTGLEINYKNYKEGILDEKLCASVKLTGRQIDKILPVAKEVYGDYQIVEVFNSKKTVAEYNGEIEIIENVTKKPIKNK